MSWRATLGFGVLGLVFLSGCSGSTEVVGSSSPEEIAAVAATVGAQWSTYDQSERDGYCALFFEDPDSAMDAFVVRRGGEIALEASASESAIREAGILVISGNC